MEKKRKLVVLILGLQDWKKIPVLDRLTQTFWPLGQMWDVGRGGSLPTDFIPRLCIEMSGSSDSPLPTPSPCLLLCLCSLFPCIILFKLNFLKVIQTQGPSSPWFHFQKETWFIQLFIAESETFFFLLLPFWDEVGFFLVLTPHFGGRTGWMLGGVAKPRVMRTWNLHFGASTPRWEDPSAPAAQGQEPFLFITIA